MLALRSVGRIIARKQNGDRSCDLRYEVPPRSHQLGCRSHWRLSDSSLNIGLLTGLIG